MMSDDAEDTAHIKRLNNMGFMACRYSPECDVIVWKVYDMRKAHHEITVLTLQRAVRWAEYTRRR